MTHKDEFSMIVGMAVMGMCGRIGTPYLSEEDIAERAVKIAKATCIKIEKEFPEKKAEDLGEKYERGQKEGKEGAKEGETEVK